MCHVEVHFTGDWRLVDGIFASDSGRWFPRSLLQCDLRQPVGYRPLLPGHAVVRVARRPLRSRAGQNVNGAAVGQPQRPLPVGEGPNLTTGEGAWSKHVYLSRAAADESVLAHRRR